jgi:hypothetical protein
MDISNFVTDNGPFHLEEGQVPLSASTAGMVQQPLTNTQSTAQRPTMTSQYQSVAALAPQYPDGGLAAIAMTQVREPALVPHSNRMSSGLSAVIMTATSGMVAEHQSTNSSACQ